MIQREFCAQRDEEILLILNEETLTQGLDYLTTQDPDLAQVVEQLGPPALRHRPAGFPTLLQIILEQKVSLASAQATYKRLVEAIGPPHPTTFLTLDDSILRSIGFSRQKVRYCRGLAIALAEGQLDLTLLTHAEDETVRATLTALPGIGPWSAEIYLLLALRRPDAWPVSDLGVIVGAQRVKHLPTRPRRPALDAMAELWRPWRSLATFILWHSL